MSRHLAVLLGGRRIGTLIQDQRTQFVYDPAYLQSTATPLSLSMPKRPEAWPQSRVLPWLNGLLPDSADVRERWAARFGVSAQNPFALVAQVGRDLPGAIQVALESEVAAVAANLGELRPITEPQIGQRLACLRTDSDSWTVAGERWSLGGAQAKFALVEQDGQWYEALGAAATTRILKPGVTGYAAQGMNEHVTMAAARALGLRVARTRYLEFDGEPAIVANRYDRLTRDNQTMRIHQEDFCQATATSPRKKYESDGGPGVARISDLLRLRADEDSNWRFVEAVAFNYLIGASDAHAKNYSVLLSGTQVRLAPLYDMASSLPYDPALDDSDLHKTAMAIGGERHYGRVGQRNWQRLARRTGTDLDRLVDRVADLARDLPDAVASAIATLPASPNRTMLQHRYLDRLQPHLEQAIARLAVDQTQEPHPGPTSDDHNATADGPVRVRAHTRSGRRVAEFYRSLPSRHSGD